MNLDLIVSLFIAVAFGAIAMLASWRASLPANPLKPRLLPWRVFMIAATLGVVLALAYAVSLLGVA